MFGLSGSSTRHSLYFIIYLSTVHHPEFQIHAHMHTQPRSKSKYMLLMLVGLIGWNCRNENILSCGRWPQTWFSPYVFMLSPSSRCTVHTTRPAHSSLTIPAFQLVLRVMAFENPTRTNSQIYTEAHKLSQQSATHLRGGSISFSSYLLPPPPSLPLVVHAISLSPGFANGFLIRNKNQNRNMHKNRKK